MIVDREPVATNASQVAFIVSPNASPVRFNVSRKRALFASRSADDCKPLQVRLFGEFAYAANAWNTERRVIARLEASDRGTDSRFIVTNLAGTPRWLYEAVYC